MKLICWRGEVPNFGDALNSWLWPRLLPGFFDDDPGELFIGIGSILFDHYPSDARKLVFGAGYGGYTAAPRIDGTWDVRFVRGPRTAKTLGLDSKLALGDPATLIRHCWDALPRANGHAPAGFMPHWESALYGNWASACAQAGVRYIDPRWPVDRVLGAIRGCDVLVTEAMHGAIVADALRIPWIPFQPLPDHTGKWLDWTESQQLEIHFCASARSTWLESVSSSLGRGALQDFVRARGIRGRSLGSGAFRARATAAIRAAAAGRSYLTSDLILEETTAKMLRCLEEVRRSSYECVLSA